MKEEETRRGKKNYKRKKGIWLRTWKRREFEYNIEVEAATPSLITVMVTKTNLELFQT